MSDYSSIIEQLPYEPPFLFVDQLHDVNENGVSGVYTFKADEYFYQGHFKDHPVTPGVILTECMAQIGLVCLGIYLNGIEKNSTREMTVGLTESDMQYLQPVYPGETVTVLSEKVYFRFGKLKCKVSMKNGLDSIVCQGTISGMLIPKRSE